MANFPSGNHWGTAVLNTVQTYTRHLCGTAGYSASTTPTLTDVHDFLDDAYYNIALMVESYGYSATQTDTEVSGVLKSLHALEAVIRIELGTPTNSQNGEGNARYKALKDSRDRLTKMIENDGLAKLGATKTDARSAHIVLTGSSIAAKNTNYDDTDLVQPRFRRDWGQHPSLGDTDTDTDE